MIEIKLPHEIAKKLRDYLRDTERGLSYNEHVFYSLEQTIKNEDTFEITPSKITNDNEDAYTPICI